METSVASHPPQRLPASEPLVSVKRPPWVSQLLGTPVAQVGVRLPGFPESTRPNGSQSLAHPSLRAGHRDSPLKPNVTQINLGLPPLKACLSIRAMHNCPHICLQNALRGGRGQSPEGHGDVTSAGWASADSTCSLPSHTATL